MNDKPRKFFCITACQVDYQPNIACFNGIVSRVISFRHFSAIFIRYILCWISVVNGWAVSYSILMTLKCLARSKQIWYTCTFTSFAICAAKPSNLWSSHTGLAMIGESIHKIFHNDDVISLQRSHMRVMEYQLTGNLTLWTTACSD